VTTSRTKTSLGNQTCSTGSDNMMPLSALIEFAPISPNTVPWNPPQVFKSHCHCCQLVEIHLRIVKEAYKYLEEGKIELMLISLA